MSIPTLVLDLSIFESIRPPWLQEPLCLLWQGIEQDYPTRMCPLNLQGSYFTHIRIFFFHVSFFLLLLELTFQTFLCFHPSAQTLPEWPQITAMPTLVFNPMSCHSSKFKPVYKAASEDPSSTLPPYNLPALLLSLCLLFCKRKTKQKNKSSGRKGCLSCQREEASLLSGSCSVLFDHSKLAFRCTKHRLVTSIGSFN